LLGLEFADLSPAEAAALIASRGAGAPFRYVVTPNAGWRANRRCCRCITTPRCA